MSDNKIAEAQAIVVGRLKQKLGDDAHLLDRLIATRGKRKGFLKKTPPRCGTEEEALHQAIMYEANPYQISVGRVMFMPTEQRKKFEKWRVAFDGFKGLALLCKDRVSLEMLGVY
jgi:hypothetical protein